MSDQLFEVAFAGEIADGADLDDVKAKVGKMFNADADKLAALFSGKRIVIKKNIDQATAAKYRTALNRAGAVCEVKPMGGGAAAAAPAANPAAAKSAPAETAPAPAAQQYEAGDYGDVPPPPQTDPLGITPDQIEDLAVDIAPVGSELQSAYDTAEEPQIDISALDVAPVGADLSDGKKQAEPPPPDTSGITLEES